MIAEALKGLAALQNSNSASETRFRLNRGLHYVTCARQRWLEYLTFQSLEWLINMGIPYCMASLFLAYKDRNPLPILFSLFLRTRHPHVPPRVVPDQATAVVVPSLC